MLGDILRFTDAIQRLALFDVIAAGLVLAWLVE